MTPHELNIFVHVISGAAGVAAGVFVLCSRKGERFHRSAGHAFVWIAAFSFITAVVGVMFFDPLPPLMSATLAFGYQYLSGLRALDITARGPAAIDFALSAGGLAACGALYLQMGSGTASWPPAIGYSAIGWIAAIIVYDLSRFLWPSAWYNHVRPLDHGLKMTGAYFAMVSAGAGNLLSEYQPWSQVAPSAVGILFMLGFAMMYVLKIPGSGNSSAGQRRNHE